MSDAEIAELIIDAAIKEGFTYDNEKREIIYEKEVLDEPLGL